MVKESPSHNPHNLVHLFLKDAPRFFVSFMNRLEQQVPAAKAEIDAIKQNTIVQLKQIYTQDQLDHWRKEGLERKLAIFSWSSKEELERQQQALSLIKTRLYDALVAAETEIALEHDFSYDDVTLINVAVQKLYDSILSEMRDKKFEELSASGRFEIKSQASVPVDGVPVQTLAITFGLHQYGDVYVPFYAPQDLQGLHPINALSDEISIKTPQGQIFSLKKCRSAILDFFTYRKELSPAIPTQEIEKERQQLNRLDRRDLRKHIDTIVKQQNPVLLQHLVDALEWDSSTMGPPSVALEPYLNKRIKYVKELENLLNDQEIIEMDKACMEELLAAPQRESLGVSIPPGVKTVFQQHPMLKGGGFAMINLLYPFNLFTSYTLNKFVARKMDKQGYPSRTLEELDLLTLNNNNQLDSIYRELIAFKEIGIKRKAQHLFFNIPIQLTLGIGQMSLPNETFLFPLGPHLVYSSHDIVRSQAISEETNQNFSQVHTLAKTAIQVLDEEYAKSRDKTLLLYKTTLKCLLEQTFETNTTMLIKDQAGIKFYDLLARLTLLLEMLNFHVNVHDYHGMTFLSLWSAKCNQLLACLATSTDGMIPSIDITSVPLDPASFNPRTEQFSSHWSQEIFLKSLPLNIELLKARKAGSKSLFFNEAIENEALRRALVLGNLVLFTAFSVDSLNKARLRLE